MSTNRPGSSSQGTTQSGLRSQLNLQLSKLKLKPIIKTKLFGGIKVDHSKDQVGLSVEGMRLLVHAENEIRLKRGEPKFNCYVVDLPPTGGGGIFGPDVDFKPFHDFIAQLKRIPVPESGDVRTQLIVKNRGHYTAIDFKISKAGIESIILDAAHDARIIGYSMALREDDSIKSVYTAMGKDGKNIQKDDCSCPIFSFDHACQISRIDLYDELKTKPNISAQGKSAIVTWDELPPQLVWNCQSLTWLDAYAKSHPESVNQKIPGTDMSFNEYIDAGKKLGWINIDTKQPKQVNVNGSIDKIFESYGNAARAYVASLPTAKLEELVRPPTEIKVAPAQPAPTAKQPSERSKQNDGVELQSAINKLWRETIGAELAEIKSKSSTVVKATDERLAPITALYKDQVKILKDAFAIPELKSAVMDLAKGYNAGSKNLDDIFAAAITLQEKVQAAGKWVAAAKPAAAEAQPKEPAKITLVDDSNKNIVGAAQAGHATITADNNGSHLKILHEQARQLQASATSVKTSQMAAHRNQAPVAPAPSQQEAPKPAQQTPQNFQAQRAKLHAERLAKAPNSKVDNAAMRPRDRQKAVNKPTQQESTKPVEQTPQNFQAQRAELHAERLAKAPNSKVDNAAMRPRDLQEAVKKPSPPPLERKRGVIFKKPQELCDSHKAFQSMATQAVKKHNDAQQKENVRPEITNKTPGKK